MASDLVSPGVRVFFFCFRGFGTFGELFLGVTVDLLGTATVLLLRRFLGIK